MKKFFGLALVVCLLIAHAVFAAQFTEWDVKAAVGFDKDSTALTGENLEILKKEVKVMIAKAPKEMLIKGYCDTQEDCSKHLGLKRAQATADKLVELGLDPKKVSISLDESQQPLSKDDTEASHKFNRVATIAY